MNENTMNLTSAEWRVMECLWEHAPRTGRELTQQLQECCGWSRSTTLTLLSRMEAKGAVSGDTASGIKTFSPCITRENAALQETESFLERVYKGSVSMMVSALTQRQSLSKREIAELYAILKEAEGNEDA